MTLSNLLIDDTPLQLLPQLAKAVGLNEAVILQQIHFWVKGAERRRDNRHRLDGHWWVWNDYADWQRDNFPFWSTRTIQRTVLELEARGLLISAQPKGQDRTKWYRIDYDELAKSIMPGRHGHDANLARSDNAKVERSKVPDRDVAIGTETLTETPEIKDLHASPTTEAPNTEATPPHPIAGGLSVASEEEPPAPDLTARLERMKRAHDAGVSARAADRQRREQAQSVSPPGVNPRRIVGGQR